MCGILRAQSSIKEHTVRWSLFEDEVNRRLNNDTTKSMVVKHGKSLKKSLKIASLGI